MTCFLSLRQHLFQSHRSFGHPTGPANVAGQHHRVTRFDPANHLGTQSLDVSSVAENQTINF
jgi:hypothetical protein